MKNIHNLLKRQMKKCFGESSPVPKGCHNFIKTVNDAYIQSDIDRQMLERALDLSSQELLEANTDLKTTLSLLHTTIESTTDGILVVNLAGEIVFFNKKFLEMWHIPQHIVDSREDNEALSFVLSQLKDPGAFLNKVKELYSQQDAESYDLLEFQDGKIFERHSKPQKLDGKSVGRVWSFRDITEKKKVEKQITNMAYFDTLTNLPNRYLLKDRLSQAILYSEKYKKQIAILYLDLDNFKRINDTFGHTIGDQLLQAVSSRLEKHIRKIDTLSRSVENGFETTVARLGGDEFTILLREVKKIQDASKVAQRIIDLFSQPFTLDNRELHITTSIGISLYPNDGEDVDTLLKNADTAMYYAKDSGKNTFQFFTETMNKAVFERFIMESNLRKAQDRKEFALYYQPQFDISTKRIIGVEALVRWRHPEKGLLLPDTFIPVAEETGIIIPLGEWILKTACEQARAWQLDGYDPISVTVNISSVQFKQKNFAEFVAQALLDSGLQPEYLEVELTESILMEPTEITFKKLNELKATGVRLAIDDFGTGYSSLGYLKRLPIDTLKIDRSFVRDIVFDPDDRAIIKAMIMLARTLNLKVIAEGVETSEQLVYLQEQGGDGVQGFLLSHPLPSDSMTNILKDRQYQQALLH